jgi:hypothetical protein
MRAKLNCFPFRSQYLALWLGREISGFLMPTVQSTVEIYYIEALKTTCRQLNLGRTPDLGDEVMRLPAFDLSGAPRSPQGDR